MSCQNNPSLVSTGATLSFDAGVHTGLGYHVHFPGCSERGLKRSGIVSSTGIVSLSIPCDANAVSVTLVARRGRGWTRHSRCRFSSNTIGRLFDEQGGDGKVNDNPHGYGNVTLSGSQLRNTESQTPIHNSWFYISENVKRVFGKSNKDWYTTLRPEDPSIEHVHMTTWNNLQDSLVHGWCFAFSPSPDVHYAAEDILASFEQAHNLLHVNTNIYANLLSLSSIQKDEILALGVTLFGMSIFFADDRTLDRVQVERFSSTARLDGIGDCEDITKESAMAFGDIHAYRDTDVLLAMMAHRSRRFQYCICLGTVRRPDSDCIESHAYGMLIPNCVFPEDMLTEEELEQAKYDARNSQECLRTYLCDGVYDCHPSKEKTTEVDVVEKQSITWTYGFVASAFVYNKGQVYFTHRSKTSSYGVQFSSLFPRVHRDIRCVNALGDGVTFMDRRAAAADVLMSNVPRALRTFQRNSQTPMDRFETVVCETKDRAKNILSTFDNMCITEQRRFNRLAVHMRAPVIDPESFDELFSHTSKRSEMAFQIDSRGHVTTHTQGSFGRVKEPSPPSLNAGTAVSNVGGHTHHRGHGEDEYRAHNVPTPEDFVSFAARRVIAILKNSNSFSGEKRIALQKSAVIVTHMNVYELNDIGLHSGLVTSTYLQCAIDNLTHTDDSVWFKVRENLSARVKACATNAYIDVTGTRFVIKPNVDIFSENGKHDAYLAMMTHLTGIRCGYISTEKYKQLC